MMLFRYRSLTMVVVLVIAVTATIPMQAQDGLTYPIVDTHQTHCFTADSVITCGTSFAGQDAEYTGNAPAYQVNGDGTVTDIVTGLMWQQDPGPKTNYDSAIAGVNGFNLAGYTDWRVPTIKELYSLIVFTGLDPSGESSVSDSLRPFIDDSAFVFSYGDTNAGERVIDSQWVTSNVYNSTVMNGEQCFFGVNFADGRIKCYPTSGRGSYFSIYVRGNPSYGANSYVDNGNGTVSDAATGLTWTQSDNGTGVLWQDALAYCETLDFAGASDWRLPNIKELHSLTDYSRSPDITGSAAIDPIFNVTGITNEGGQPDFPFYWSSTTHVSSNGSVSTANYVSFGRALGNMNGWVDVHGAGAQRSDPKTGITQDEAQNGRGPQGDAVRAFNYVRCVRGGVATPSAGDDPSTLGITVMGAPSAPSGGQTGGNGGNGGETPPNGNGQAGGNSGGGQGGTPPQPALDACAGLSEGAACSFQSPNGTINGTCRATSSGTACAP
jgi:hypothetical protein